MLKMPQCAAQYISGLLRSIQRTQDIERTGPGRAVAIQEFSTFQNFRQYGPFFFISPAHGLLQLLHWGVTVHQHRQLGEALSGGERILLRILHGVLSSVRRRHLNGSRRWQ